MSGIITQEKDKTDLTQPKMYKVMLHNDQRTPREFVVHVLAEVFKKSENSSISIMMKAHQSGFSIVGVYTFDVAETRVYNAMQMAAEFEFPLLFTLDEMDD